MGITQRLGTIPLAIQTDASNNVGIGGSPSGSYKLEVTGNGKFTSASFPLDIYGTTNNYGLRINNVQAATLFLYSSNANAASRNWGLFTNSEVYGDFDIRQSNAINGDLTNGANSTSKFYIKNNGNVGIGTSSPLTILQLNSAAGTNSTLYFGVNGTMNGYLGQAASAGSLSNNAAIGDVVLRSQTNLLFTSGGDTERMRITSGGQLTTTFNTADNNAVFANINSNPYGPWIKFTTDPNNTTNYYLVCSALVGGTEYNKLKITSNGNVYNVTGTYSSGVSDIRYKEQIVDANSQWNDIKSLRVVNFKFIKDVEQNGDNALRQIGFIAQEVEKVSPNLIDEMSDEKTGETWKTIKASIIHTKAIKALQEVMARIEILEERLNKAGL